MVNLEETTSKEMSNIFEKTSLKKKKRKNIFNNMLEVSILMRC